MLIVFSPLGRVSLRQVRHPEFFCQEHHLLRAKENHFQARAQRALADNCLLRQSARLFQSKKREHEIPARSESFCGPSRLRKRVSFIFSPTVAKIRAKRGKYTLFSFIILYKQYKYLLFVCFVKHYKADSYLKCRSERIWRRVQLPSGRICASVLRLRQFRGIRLSRLARSPSNLVRLWLKQAGIEVQNTFLLRR